MNVLHNKRCNTHRCQVSNYIRDTYTQSKTHLHKFIHTYPQSYICMSIQSRTHTCTNNIYCLQKKNILIIIKNIIGSKGNDKKHNKDKYTLIKD